MHLFFTKRQNFRLVQIESICRRYNKCELKIEIALGRVENIVGKRENAGYQHFLLFPQCFQKVFLSGSFKIGLCGKKLSPRFYQSTAYLYWHATSSRQKTFYMA